MDERGHDEGDRDRGSAARIAGRFEVQGLLGEGPSAKVYRVLDHRDGGERPATLKILRADALGEEESFEALTERARPLRELDHARIQHMLDVGQTDLGLVYLESEYTPGENLRTLLARRGKLPKSRALEIARQIVAALEFGHKRGVAHGALHSGNVLLLDRVPFDKDNPWAVGVRLLDFGVKELFGAKAEAPADFDALEVLYREMIGDATANLAYDMAEAKKAPKRTERGPKRVTRPAEKPLPPMRPVEQRPPARGGYALAAAAALVALVLFVLWLRERGDESAVLAEAPAEELEELRAALEAERQRADAAEDTLERERAAAAEPVPRVSNGSGDDEALARELERLAGEVKRLGSELERWKEAGREARQRADELENQLAAATGERQNLERELTSSQAELLQVRTRLNETRRVLDLAGDAELLAVDYLERALAALEADDPVAARGHLDAWSSDDTFAGREIAGMDFVDLLTACAVATETAEDEPLLRLADLREAAAALERARGLESTLDDAAWMNRDDGSGADRDRTARLGQALARVDARLKADRAALSKTLGTRWRRLVFEYPDRDPAEVLAIADWFGDGRLEEFLAWYGEYLFEEVETKDGQLDLPALFQQRHLDDWGDALAARPETHGSHAAREVLLYRYARSWENDPPETGAPAHPVYFQASDGGPVTGWRADLQLRSRLLAEDSAYPGLPGSRFLYRTTAAPDAGTPATAWRLDEIESVERDPAELEEGVLQAWVVLQRFYRENGSYLSGRRIRLVQRGKAIYEERREDPVIDLGSGALGFASNRIDELPDVPTRLPLDGADHDAFREAFLGVDWRCAVVPGKGRTSWFSPDWGCLWVDDPSRVTIELVYASVPGR